MPRWINRAAIVVRPAKPFLEWAAAVEAPEPGEIEELARHVSVYLVGEDPAGEEEAAPLEDYVKKIFEAELAAWWNDKAAWPKERTLKTFLEWFHVAQESVVTDLESGPITHERAA